MIGEFGYWDAAAWSAIFAILTAALLLLFAHGKTRRAKTFLCGEEMEYHTPVKRFYSGFEDVLDRIIVPLKAYQTGLVNDYIAYVLIFGAVVVIIVAARTVMGLP